MSMKVLVGGSITPWVELAARKYQALHLEEWRRALPVVKSKGHQAYSSRREGD